MKLTEHFYKSEFDSKDGAEMPPEVLDNIQDLAENLELLRRFFNKPITINSGYRSPEHNKAVGGAKNSQHKLGQAADIVVKDTPPEIVADVIEGLIRLGLMEDGGIGRYETFTHYDRRGVNKRWSRL